MRKEGQENPSLQNPNILRIIPGWRRYFLDNSPVLLSQCVVAAQGGTVDSILNKQGRLEPIPHRVTIKETKGKTASEIAKLFMVHGTRATTLGDLYGWTLGQADQVPWFEVRVKHASRISSFDSAQEELAHFAAAIKYDYHVLTFADNIDRSQGTDSLIDKETLETIILSQFLAASGKKIVVKGAAIPGYEEGTDAISNVGGGLYVLLEKELPGGIYIPSSLITPDGEIVTQILPALGSVELHSDGRFHAPNSGPLLTIHDRTVYIHPLFYEFKKRISHFSSLPDFPSIYLKTNEGIDRLQRALESVQIETVKNDPSILDNHYEAGKRAFVIKARGKGNGSDEWREEISKILRHGDTTVMIITMADSGDVNLHKYAAGLDVPGALSGRTLREEAALVLSGIIQDLQQNNQLSIKPQQLIDLFCYLSGMIELPQEELTSLTQRGRHEFINPR